MKFSYLLLAFAIIANFGCASTKVAERRISPSVAPIKKNITTAQLANDRLIINLDRSSIRTKRLRDKIIILLERHRKT